jgi:hypothetical protein
MSKHNIVLSPGSLEALQARYGLRVAARLTEASQDLPHEVSERLKAARELAMERVRLAQQAQCTTSVQAMNGGGSTLTLGRGGKGGRLEHWLKLASLLPILALVAGFLMIERLHVRSQIRTAAEIDAALLADDVPPSAYSDPGFVEFLKTPRE